ncbi:helix-turn-helix transcriptional regulator [Maricaulis maris]|nr:AraC family transcriptional regulator [Maricaulis maris]
MMMKRQKILATAPGLDIQLTWYQPGQSMADHVHADHQVSWLISGDMRETSAGREHDLLRVSRGVKPAGCRHANLYGPDGALVLALNLQPGSPFCADLPGLDDWVWAASGEDMPGEIIRIALALSDGRLSAGLALPDLAARITAPPRTTPCRSAQAPDPWLARVREQLRDAADDPDLAQLAENAGVHRVHLSRSFARHYGMPPSLYRLHCKLGRGISGLMQGDSPVQAAQAGGFADQPHFTRAARRQTGLTPHRIRTLMAA